MGHLSKSSSLKKKISIKSSPVNTPRFYPVNVAVDIGFGNRILSTKLLKKINNNDVLFYLDSKYYFIADFMKFTEDCLRISEYVVWKNKPNEPTYYMKHWCKMDVIQKYNMFKTVFTDNAEDCWGGALLLKKTERTIKYVNEWFTMCCDYENITDSPSKIPNDAIFKEHRHDQSLLSVIVHTYGIPLFFFEKRYLQNVRVPF